MINSVGFVILWNNKVLLTHPRKQGYDTWGIAKGKIEANETFLECAIRETKEEIGIVINKNILPENIEWKTIIYKNLKNKAYKKLHYTIIKIDNLSDIGMINEIVDFNKLDTCEIDEAKFMTIEEADKKIFWRQREFLDLLRNNLI
jgi:8-oxo-dGTP pyrophosphatase MutT (NUDIX family)